MREPHIIACVKVVPKPEEVGIHTETMTIERGGVRSEINPPDMNALEMALSLKDRHGGRVSLISMGPPFFGQYLRLGLAMGADEAYLLSDSLLGGADTLATSYALAQGIRHIAEFDLVLCGEESSDGATGQVPPGIAEWLDIPQFTYVCELEIMPGQWRVQARREIPRGYEVLQAAMPCLASINVGSNEPRFVDMERKAWAEREGSLTFWTVADLGIDPQMAGVAGSPTRVSTVARAASAERKREFLRGSPEEKARALTECLRGYV